MKRGKYLIVNADDLGLSQGVNSGIIKAHEQGIVTSASLMVRYPYAGEVAAYRRAYPGLSIGMHLDLGEWKYANDEWVLDYEVVSFEDEKALNREVLRQFEAFRDIVGTGPTHIDSHQHVHRSGALKDIIMGIADGLKVPLRHFSPKVRYCGDFYGQTDRGTPFPENISTDGMIKILSSLQAGITELACHPGNGETLNTAYSAERLQELKVLCDPLVRKTINELGIELCSFSTLPV